jgi:hypothetical protein
MWEEITVSKKILGHISAGVYRSAGGALKELVSNAFDANARHVIITTNWPSFDIFTCRDDGDGMTSADFRRIMTGGIGDSTKRITAEYTDDLRRPIIGWLGIGMLGVAQICHEFTITCHHRQTKTAFKASVKLVDFLREKIVESEALPPGAQLLEVGQFSIEDISYEADLAGTYIVASDMRSAFVRKFREIPGPPLPSKFSAFLEIIHQQRAVKELGDYWQMVWDLCITSPIPYMNDGPFDWNKVSATKHFQLRMSATVSNLQQYDFEVVVDGLSIRKPNQYPYPSQRRDESAMTGQVFEIDQAIEVYGQPLVLFGYLYMQAGQAIEPFELRGALLRIRSVAIGSYDPTFLKYPKIEGPRFNWLSGEIFVEKGLEYALNIDRDSFNEVHPHYVRLQRIVHHVLAEAFSEASQGVRDRSRSKRLATWRARRDALREVVQSELGGDFSIIESDATLAAITIDPLRKLLAVNPQSEMWPRSQARREIAELAAIAFEVAMLMPASERQVKFYHVLNQLLSKV